MINFIRDNLAVCGFAGIGRREEFESMGFTAQLQCTEHFDAWLHESLEVKCLPFDDGVEIPQSIADEGLSWLLGHWLSGSKILISCAGGRSRSVTMSIALLSRATGASFLDAAREVMGCIPEAYPHPEVLGSAARYCNEPLALKDLQAIYQMAQVQPPFPWSVEAIRQAVADKG